MAESQASPLSGPERLVLRQPSARGPFAAWRTVIELSPVRFSLTDSGAAVLDDGRDRAEVAAALDRDADLALDDLHEHYRALAERARRR